MDTENYLELFLNDVPMMDVRAPVEFDRGAFPNTANVPLLDDEQRDAVGKRYKDAGQEEAIQLGLQLATPEMRAQRLRDWKRFVASNPLGYLYCFRGGLRSRTTQAWLKEQGVDYPLIKGGYKAMRNFLLEQLEICVEQIPFIMLGGLTGSGKTRVLKRTRYHVDLEGLANHRGSAFGRDVTDYQPTPVNWENQLSIACLKYRHRFPAAGMLLEDEGKMIGRLLIPKSFYHKMLASPRILLQREFEERVSIIREDYFALAWPVYQQSYYHRAEEKFSAFVLDSLARIRNRLGGERHKVVHDHFTRALTHLFSTGESHHFDDGIRVLLRDYYDPMYRYQLAKKAVQVLFSGSEQEIVEWADSHLAGMKE